MGTNALLQQFLRPGSSEPDRRLDEARSELEERLLSEIRRALVLYRGQRLAGSVCLCSAIFLSAANFII